MKRAWIVVVLAGGGCRPYHAGSYLDGDEPFAGVHVDLGGCLDLAVAMPDDADARGDVLEYSFGNRCERGVKVDLASIHAVSRADDGSTTELVAFDPRHEIVPLSLDGMWQGHERIEYTSPTGARVPEICVDVGRVDRSAAPRARWVCNGVRVVDELASPGGA